MILAVMNANQTPLKSSIFQASIRNCINCVHNCADHSLFEYENYNKYLTIINKPPTNSTPASTKEDHFKIPIGGQLPPDSSKPYLSYEVSNLFLSFLSRMDKQAFQKTLRGTSQRFRKKGRFSQNQSLKI